MLSDGRHRPGYHCGSGPREYQWHQGFTLIGLHGQGGHDTSCFENRIEGIAGRGARRLGNQRPSRQRRVMERATIIGERPVGPLAS